MSHRLLAISHYVSIPVAVNKLQKLILTKGMSFFNLSLLRAQLAAQSTNKFFLPGTCLLIVFLLAFPNSVPKVLNPVLNVRYLCCYIVILPSKHYSNTKKF